MSDHRSDPIRDRTPDPMPEPDPEGPTRLRKSAAASPAGTVFAPHPGLRFDSTGQPFDPVYRDVFRSRAGAWQEARAVFIEGCRVPERWRGAGSFCVLELGFGLGVNFLATLAAWRSDPQRSPSLHFVSIEAHPLSRADLERGLAALGCDRIAGDFAQGLAGNFATDRDALLAGWPPRLPGLHRLRFAGGAVTLTLAFGGAHRMLPRLSLAADAVYLDGFAPTRNPQMWDPGLIRALTRLVRPGARLATWSAASAVREALAAAGFEVSRVAGWGGKRHRTEAVLAPRWPSWPAPSLPARLGRRHAIVVGAGLAGAGVAEGFARRGFTIDLLDSHPGPGGEGSRQPLLADHLHLSPDDNPMARLTRAALLLRPRENAGPPIGRLSLASGPQGAVAQGALLAKLAFPADFVRRLDPQEASDVAGVTLRNGGLWTPACQALSPARAIAGWLERGGAAIRFIGGVRVARIEREASSGEWMALDACGRTIAAAPVVVLANAGDAVRLGGLASLSPKRIRGQTTCLRDPQLAGLRTVLGGDAYAAPTGIDGRVLVGASFSESASPLPDPRDDLGNLHRLGRMLDRDAQSMLAGAIPAAVGFRHVLPDRLPAIGPLPDETAAIAIADQLSRNDRMAIPLACGLYGAFAFGSRGLLWAALAAEVLPAIACGEPIPIERELLEAIAPARLLRRRLRRGLLR